jgi:hypothetical protein
MDEEGTGLKCFAGQAFGREARDYVPDVTVLNDDGISEVHCIFRQMFVSPVCGSLGDRRQQEDRALIVYKKIDG